VKNSSELPTAVIDLGLVGASWIRTSLQDGLSLSRAFLDRRGQELDHALTIAPRDVGAEEAIGSLSKAQLLPLAESERRLTQILMEGPASTLLIVEDDLARADDPSLEHVQNRVLYLGKEVYHVFEVIDDPGVVGPALRSGSGFPTNAFVVPPSAPLSPYELQTSSLEAIVDHALFVIVMGFDGGGYVFWRGNNRRNDS
jgi:hypothetical protein